MTQNCVSQKSFDMKISICLIIRPHTKYSSNAEITFWSTLSLNFLIQVLSYLSLEIYFCCLLARCFPNVCNLGLLWLIKKTLMLGGIGGRRRGDSRGWDDWMASRTRWTWVWVNSGRRWWTGRPGVLRFMGLQRVGHDWATELKGQRQQFAVDKAFFCCWMYLDILPVGIWLIIY